MSENNESRNNKSRRRYYKKKNRGNKTPAAAPETAAAFDPVEEEAEDMDVAPEVPEVSEMTPDVAEDETPTVEIIGVRFKSGGKVYYFDPNGITFSAPSFAVVETARGQEYGEVTVANRLVRESEIVQPLRHAVRVATEDDRRRHEANAEKEREARDVCCELIEKHKLPMKLVDVEYTFDNSKLLFYFTSDCRVDFRELVKDLASVFRTRIELRQIGIRDEAKLMGGLGVCGRPFCCKTFLNDFVQVSIKMAKEQNLSLNSVKISGTCGRLMCCLRYEYETYEEEIRKTPKVDARVMTEDGEGVVIDTTPLAGLIKVRLTENPDAVPKVYHRDDVKVLAHGGQAKADRAEKNSRAEKPDTDDASVKADGEEKSTRLDKSAGDRSEGGGNKNGRRRPRPRHRDRNKDKNTPPAES